MRRRLLMPRSWIGLVNLVATFIAIALVDKAGRKPLLLFGNAIQVVALGSVGWIFASNPHSPLLLWLVVLYIAAFAMAMGPLPWIVCSEIFPAKLRAGDVRCDVLHLARMPDRRANLSAFPAASGAVANVWGVRRLFGAHVPFVLLRLPETKGRTLEEIEMSWRGR